MLFSLALIILLGLIAAKISKILKLPSLIGMLIVGIIIGPSVLDLLDVKILAISSELRKIALIIILTRAGLNLDLNKLKEVGISAILMCFIPATFEIIGFAILGPMILNLDLIESLLLGSVIAAVSPAVIVPRMIKLQKESYGKNKNIPELILAGASVDDIFVIVLFTCFLNLNKTGTFDGLTLFRIPSSIILGIIAGYFLSLILIKFFKKYQLSNVLKLMLVLSISFILIKLEDSANGIIAFSGLLAIMMLGIMINQKDKAIKIELSKMYDNLWVLFEIILFVLVGAEVDINYALNSSLNAILIILLTLLFRSFGVIICVIKSKLNNKEKLFTIFSYLPKATVQASIGAIALNEGLACGNMILTVAVIAILLTAPLGAILIDSSYKKLLCK